MPSWPLAPFVTIESGSLPPWGRGAGTTKVRTVSPSRKSIARGERAASVEAGATDTIAASATRVAAMVRKSCVFMKMLLLLGISCHFFGQPTQYARSILQKYFGCYRVVTGV